MNDSIDLKKKLAFRQLISASIAEIDDDLLYFLRYLLLLDLEVKVDGISIERVTPEVLFAKQIFVTEEDGCIEIELRTGESRLRADVEEINEEIKFIIAEQIDSFYRLAADFARDEIKDRLLILWDIIIDSIFAFDEEDDPEIINIIMDQTYSRMSDHGYKITEEFIDLFHQAEETSTLILVNGSKDLFFNVDDGNLFRIKDGESELIGIIHEEIDRQIIDTIIVFIKETKRAILDNGYDYIASA